MVDLFCVSKSLTQSRNGPIEAKKNLMNNYQDRKAIRGI